MKKLVLFSLAVSLLASCSKSDSNEPDMPTPPQPEKIEIKISAGMDNSRATDYTFETGDQIGLYVVNNVNGSAGQLMASGNHVDNMRFTYSGAWTPDSPIYWADNITPADFYIYYPYTKVSSVLAMPFEVKSNQSNVDDYKSSELLVGKVSGVKPTASTIAITAKHVLSRINVVLQAGDGFTPESLTAANPVVKVNGLKTKSTVNLANGIVTPTGEAVSVYPCYDNGLYKALVIPQTVAEQNLITITVAGKDYNLVKGFTFESGKSHTFTCTINKTSSGINVNISAWETDGNDNGGVAE